MTLQQFKRAAFRFLAAIQDDEPAPRDIDNERQVSLVNGPLDGAEITWWGGDSVVDVTYENVTARYAYCGSGKAIHIERTAAQ